MPGVSYEDSQFMDSWRSFSIISWKPIRIRIGTGSSGEKSVQDE